MIWNVTKLLVHKKGSKPRQILVDLEMTRCKMSEMSAIYRVKTIHFKFNQRWANSKMEVNYLVICQLREH